MSPCDAVDGSSTGIAICQNTIDFWSKGDDANFGFWH